MSGKKPFQFEISLSVLNHLGRNLYRNFITVLGEAVSNAWDADANNVWIYIDKDSSSFVIKDDGCGMNEEDFQTKFLKVGYSKRKSNGMMSPNKRPYIGAKGIGKLALLSCAEKISIISKTLSTEYVGGLINNTGLTDAIENDLTPDKYPLEEVDLGLFDKYILNHKKGTVIYFDQTKDDIKNTISYLKKLIALYFRFSLVDDSFNIFVNDAMVTIDDLKDLSDATEFLWNINDLKDPFTDTLLKLKNDPIKMQNNLKIVGFIATVEKPKFLKITGTEEKIGIDLFVNGRLREKDILKHLPDFSTRHIASYLYGQIHFDELDKDGSDRFTSSREGIVQGDDKHRELLEELKNNILGDLSNKWDELRLARDEDGDDENPRKTVKERRALSMYNLSSKDYSEGGDPEIKKWIKELQPEAEFNIPAYVDCFLSENLIRKYIKEKKVPLSSGANDEIQRFKDAETNNKNKGNISIDIRSSGDDISYLSMDGLAYLVDKKDPIKEACLARDANEYKPIRDALAHTSLLTVVAKQRLTLVYENIKQRLKNLLFSKK
jgi:hypothetical protein